MDSQLLSEKTELPELPVEMHEHLISVCSFYQLLCLSDVSLWYRTLVIAEVIKRLNKFKETIIKNGFRVDFIPICYYLTEFDSDFCEVKQNDNNVTFSGIHLILKFIRLFGHEIEYVVCDFHGASKEQACTVFSYVSQYCSGLKRLAFGNLNYDLGISLEKPFETVTYVFFQRCMLHDQLCHLKALFPNVKEIVFSEENRFESLDEIIVVYGSLERFEICSASIDVVNGIFLQLLNPEAEVSFFSNSDGLLLLEIDGMNLLNLNLRI